MRNFRQTFASVLTLCLFVGGLSMPQVSWADDPPITTPPALPLKQASNTSDASTSSSNVPLTPPVSLHPTVEPATTTASLLRPEHRVSPTASSFGSAPRLSRYQVAKQSYSPLSPPKAQAGAARGKKSAFSPVSAFSLPLTFEQNRGQSEERVRYLSRGARYSFFLTANELILAVPHGEDSPAGAGNKSSEGKRPVVAPKTSALRIQFLGGAPSASVKGEDKQIGVVNYILGNEPRKWRTGIPTFAKVRCVGVYPGIDLVYYGSERQLEYDIVVAPMSDPKVIRMALHGAQKTWLDAKGDLRARLEGGGEVIHKAPSCYQLNGGRRVKVAGRYHLTQQSAGGFTVSFEVPQYDRSKRLYIDPLIYSTYLGGSGVDKASGIRLDSSSNSYVVGSTLSTNFLGVSGASGGRDAFVVKVNASGTAALYKTYLGGSLDEYGTSVAVDGSGNAYIGGYTSSTNFPFTAGVYQSANGGGVDSFVMKLNTTGGVTASTYFGKAGTDNGWAIAVDGSGNAYLAGDTTSNNLTTTTGVYKSAYGGATDGYVVKLNSGLTAATYLTYVGGNGGDNCYAIALDSAANAYVTGATGSSNLGATAGAYKTTPSGTDAFVVKLNASGAAPYVTYLGGTASDTGLGLAVDSSGKVYIGGKEISGNGFPTTTGAYQTTSTATASAWVAKLNPAGGGASDLVYATYLNGSINQTRITALAIDGTGNAYVTGYTDSTNFPVTPGAYQATFGGQQDAFYAKLNVAGSGLLYATYLGKAGDDEGFGIAVDGSRNAIVTGFTASTNFPTTTGTIQTASAGSYDAFVTKFNTLAVFRAAPGWAESVRAIGGGGGGGASAGSMVDLASGSYMHEPGGDIFGRNTVGPGAAFVRSYNTDWALNGLSSPGLPVGWKHNYDYQVQPNPQVSGALDLVYPNGAHETIRANGTAAFAAPPGAPYLVTNSGSDIYLTFLDETKWTFTLNGTNYPLRKMANRIGQTVRIDYLADGRLDKIWALNSGGGTISPALLTFTYPASGANAAYVSRVTDVYGRYVDYTITSVTTANIPALTGVSPLTPSAGPTAGMPQFDWQYGYLGYVQGGATRAFLNQVTVPDPSSTASPPAYTSSTVTYDTNFGYVNALVDANSNQNQFTYDGGTQTSVQSYTYNSGSLTLNASYTQKEQDGFKDAGTIDANNNATALTYGSTTATQNFVFNAKNENNQQTAITPDQWGRTTKMVFPRTKTVDSGAVANLATKISYQADTGVFSPGRISQIQTGSLLSDGSFYRDPELAYDPHNGNTKAATKFTYYQTGDANGVAGLLKTVTSPRPYNYFDFNFSIGAITTVTTTFTYTTLGNVKAVSAPGPNFTKTGARWLPSPTLTTIPMTRPG